MSLATLLGHNQCEVYMTSTNTKQALRSSMPNGHHNLMQLEWRVSGEVNPYKQPWLAMDLDKNAYRMGHPQKMKSLAIQYSRRDGSECMLCTPFPTGRKKCERSSNSTKQPMLHNGLFQHSSHGQLRIMIYKAMKFVDSGNSKVHWFNSSSSTIYKKIQ